MRKRWTRERVVEVFWRQVEIADADACWRWLGPHTPAGYARYHKHGEAHRFIYELESGPIADGLQIDHLCRNRWCVNPAHMEAVTQKENVLRGVSPCAINARKTHCPQGHSYADPQHLYVDRLGYRHCRTCSKARQLARREKERSAA